ncbi:nucleotidyltransferase family protein [Desertihabitans brevis]|uniref:nucleotidyltransferase family protein n=1 Tax=Desertihabitans brevis TaxID=2268447 RepID=UPI0018F4752C|nr:nucleotidyltransferase domain-containing protein [Desertihabitans brevis]
MTPVPTEQELVELADRLVQVPGVEAVALGGSRARGEAHPDSDVDLGLYYRSSIDTGALRALAGEVATTRPGTGSLEVTEPGGWGPWVDGGAWMSIRSTPVDWIYRDLDRVRRSVEDARRGVFEFAFQVGHPLGVPTTAYAGEVALARVLADPDGELRALQGQVTAYPPALTGAVLERLGEARFLLGALAKSAGRGDTSYLAGCLFRVVGLCAHAVHARAGSWVVNEKGLVDSAGRLPGAPAAFAERAHRLLGELGRSPAELTRSVQDARDLVEEVAAG